jgi:tRNA nucleotidyltransferase (CCA-adding enzyme)
VIKCNPERSKHLETATMSVMGTEVDFVNLRAEAYAGDSRVPVVEIGTATQDAERRDLTINALFYNLATREVEDFTRRGLEDLKNRVARTPLDPVVTFHDDPLRILRTARFAARFNLAVDPAILDAAARTEVRESLRVKVSRERIGKELAGLIEAADPIHGLVMLIDIGLLRVCVGGAEGRGCFVALWSGPLLLG